MTTSKGLGKGFEALIPTNFDSSILMDKSERIQKLSINSIIPNKDQPRKHFDDVSLTELANSITQHGLLQPLVVTKVDDNQYMIIAGERRWRACQIAGLKTVSAIIRSAKELEQLEIALVENVQRVDLSPLEQATSIVKLHEQFSQDYSDIAKRLGKAAPTVANIVRLLNLPEEAKQALMNKKITEGHARAILAVKETVNQLELLNLILVRGWTVRQAEQYAVAHRQGSSISKQATARASQTTTPQTIKLGESLRAPVILRRTANGGKLEIGFKSDDDLKRILKKLIG